MKEPQLTEAAKADLNEIWLSIDAGRDEKTADRILATILDRCRSHAQFPEMGRSREELAPSLRSFPVSPYIVFYRPHEDTIQVLRILHGRRDTERIMNATD